MPSSIARPPRRARPAPCTALASALVVAVGTAQQPPLAVEGARDLTGRGRAFVATVPARAACFLQEHLAIRLQVGIAAGFQAEQLTQLFRRQLDVPVQVRAPWLDGLPGAVAVPGGSAPRAGATVTLVVNDRVEHARALPSRVVDGETYAMFELQRTYLPMSTGALVLAAPVLRFVYTTRFLDDPFQGRVPTDRVDGFVRGEPQRVRVDEWPAAGRPAAFHGAVGQFAVDALPSTRQLAVGEPFQLVMTITGAGNLAQFDTPTPRAHDLLPAGDFHVLGILSAFEAGRRTWTFELVPLRADLATIPGIPFAYLDPTPPGRYRTVSTPALPVEVGGVATGGVGPTPVEAAGMADLKTTGSPAGPVRGRRSRAGVVVVLVAPWALALGFWFWRRARPRPGADQRLARARAQDAKARFDAQIERADTGVGDAVAAYLADRLGCAPAAVIETDLAIRLRAAGVPAALAARAAALLEAHVATRYGGAGAAGTAKAARAVIDALEESWPEPIAARGRG